MDISFEVDILGPILSGILLHFVSLLIAVSPDLKSIFLTWFTNLPLAMTDFLADDLPFLLVNNSTWLRIHWGIGQLFSHPADCNLR